MAPLAQERSFVVAAEEAGMRLDRFLVRHVAGLSRRGARRALEAGCVSVAPATGVPRICRRKGRLLTLGERVTVRDCDAFSDPSRLAPVPAAVPGVQVVREEASFAVFFKPAGVPSHPLAPGETGTLANAVVRRFPECGAVGGAPREAGLCHRLDALTSGLVLVARTPDAYAALRSAFRRHAVDKRYWALVAGHPPAHLEVAAPIRSRRGRRRVQVGSHGLEAITEVRRLAQGDGVALVEARSRFGRRHQVRAHLAHAGHPLVGDALYRGPAVAAWPHPPLLHAQRLVFAHPETGAPVRVTAALQEGQRRALTAVLPASWEAAVDAGA